MDVIGYSYPKLDVGFANFVGERDLYDRVTDIY